MIVKFDKFEGHDMFQVWEDEGDKFPKFACGVRKAQIILDHLPQLKEFVEKFGETAVKKPKKAKNAEG